MDNGVVVDRIYDYSPVHVREETRERARVVERRRLRIYAGLCRLKRRLRRHYGLLRLAESIASRGYLVDYDGLLAGERFVFTIFSERSMGVLEWFEERGLRRILDRILGVLGDVEPIALSRTIRGRYLLAYLIYELLRGRDPAYKDLGDLRALVSYNMFRRLKKLARSIITKHKPILEEAVGNE